MIKHLFFGTALISMSFAAPSNAINRCLEVHWKPGDIVTIKASLHKATHVVLPENHIDVIPGENSLWITEFVANHLYVKPTSLLRDGLETTVSFVGVSNQSYEFIAQRTKGPHPTCVTIKADGQLINKSAWKHRGAASNGEVRAKTMEITKELVTQTEDALRKYRKSIYTGYKIKESEGWHTLKGSLIESVYDDGRFTFIRITDDSRGLMSVYGEVDGKKELLEYKYDAPTMVYQVNGVFPEFEMKEGKSRVVIRREDT